MESFLAGSFFRLFLVPIVSVALGIYIKHVTRNDKFSKFSKEDLAVGFDLMRVALLAYMILLSDKARSLIQAQNSLASVMTIRSPSPNMAEIEMLQSVLTPLSQGLLKGIVGVVLLFLGMWVTSTIVRKKGWKSAEELDRWYGLTLPLVTGVAYLAIVMWTGV